jgi:2-phosphosulfolactate phosphatase
VPADARPEHRQRAHRIRLEWGREGAELAVAQFVAARDRGLEGMLAATASGQELIADGYAADVAMAAALDTSTAAPRLRDGLLQAG